MADIKKIEYRGFEITVREHQSRLGTAYSAINNYGEPYTHGRFFREIDDAIANEKRNLDLCLDE